MSFRTFFSMASGLSKSIRVPKGTLKRITEHIAHIEKVLKLQQCPTYGYWTREDDHWKNFPDIDDKVLCQEVGEHNEFVRWIYRLFAEWKEVKKDYETISPKQAKGFWHGLEMLTVAPERWTADYYEARMQAVYEALRGRGGEPGAEGMSIDAEPLTVAQADSVIVIFSQFLDTHDIRLSVCDGRDDLTRSDNYRWCDKKCFTAIHEDDVIEEEDEEGEFVARCPKCKEVLD